MKIQETNQQCLAYYFFRFVSASPKQRPLSISSNIVQGYNVGQSLNKSGLSLNNGKRKDKIFIASQRFFVNDMRNVITYPHIKYKPKMLHHYFTRINHAYSYSLSYHPFVYINF